jgi:RND family efflux transporter MFP subunit
MSRKEKLFKGALPVLIILFGVVVMSVMISSRKEPQQETREDPGILVEVIPVERKSLHVTVTGTGIVEAAQEIRIVPQVSGEVVWVAPSLVEGGMFEKDEVLFRIDKTDYQLAREQAIASEAQAELNLATIESRARVARAEWERMNRETGEKPNPLVVYEPQLKNARAELASARAALRQAEINLTRAEVRAPFNCRVRSEDIDLGQYVQEGTGVAVVAGTDAAEVYVPLSPDELQWLDVPQKGKGKKGSHASIYKDARRKGNGWQGRIVRSTGEVDATSRMTKIVIEVKDPYGLSAQAKPGRELVVGTFVDVALRGHILHDVFVIPRTSIRDDSTVWVMGSDNLLRIRDVEVVRSERENVFVRDSIGDGDRVVLTNLTGAADGMKLRVDQPGTVK